MRVFRGFDDLPAFRSGVATIGSFDGVHCGHKALLGRVCELARENDGESVVFTFDPHPRITLGCADGLRLLDTAEEKLIGLERAGIENVVFIPFTQEFSRLSAEEFISDYIVGKAGIVDLVVGYDHRFGRDKQGDFALLSTVGRAAGLEVVEVGQQLAGGEKVSSTVVRRAVADGDMERAARLLGEPYTVIGRVESDGEIISPEREYKLMPPAGRYAALVGGVETELTIDSGGRAYICGVAKAEKCEIKIVKRIC